MRLTRTTFSGDASEEDRMRDRDEDDVVAAAFTVVPFTSHDPFASAAPTPASPSRDRDLLKTFTNLVKCSKCFVISVARIMSMTEWRTSLNVSWSMFLKMLTEGSDSVSLKVRAA